MGKKKKKIYVVTKKGRIGKLFKLGVKTAKSAYKSYKVSKPVIKKAVVLGKVGAIKASYKFKKSVYD